MPRQHSSKANMFVGNETTTNSSAPSANDMRSGWPHESESSVPGHVRSSQSRLKVRKVLGYPFSGNKALITLGADLPYMKTTPEPILFAIRGLCAIDGALGLALFLLPIHFSSLLALNPGSPFAYRLLGACLLTMATAIFSVGTSNGPANHLLLTIHTIFGVFATAATLLQLAEDPQSRTLWALLNLFTTATVALLAAHWPALLTCVQRMC